MSSSFFLLPILKSAVFPLLGGGLTALVLGRFFKNHGRDWITALSLVIGFSIGYFAISGFNGFPPVNVADWLPYTGGAVFLAVLPFVNGKGARIAASLVLLPVIWVQFKPRLQSLSATEFTLWMAGLFLVLLVVLLIWEWADKAPQQPELLLFMVMTATSVSLCCLFGSAKMAQLGGVLASTCGGIFLALLANPSLKTGPMVRTVFVALFGGLSIQAWVYAEISPIAMSLVLLTSFFVILLRKLNFPSYPIWKRWGIVILATAIPISAAVIYLAKTVVTDDYGYDY